MRHGQVEEHETDILAREDFHNPPAVLALEDIGDATGPLQTNAELTNPSDFIIYDQNAE